MLWRWFSNALSELFSECHFILRVARRVSPSRVALGRVAPNRVAYGNYYKASCRLSIRTDSHAMVK